MILFYPALPGIVRLCTTLYDFTRYCPTLYGLTRFGFTREFFLTPAHFRTKNFIFKIKFIKILDLRPCGHPHRYRCYCYYCIRRNKNVSAPSPPNQNFGKKDCIFFRLVAAWFAEAVWPRCFLFCARHSATTS